MTGYQLIMAYKLSTWCPTQIVAIMFIRNLAELYVQWRRRIVVAGIEYAVQTIDSPI